MSDAEAATGAASANCLDAALLTACLAQLDGDVASLCAAACVSKAWSAAALDDARAWRRLRVAPPAAAKLTDARLEALLRRCAGGLERIDVSGCDQLTEGAIARALAGARDTLTHVAVADTAIAACCVEAALGDARLTFLSVRGVEAFDDLDNDGGFADEEAKALVQALKACVSEDAAPRESDFVSDAVSYTVRRKGRRGWQAPPLWFREPFRDFHYAKHPRHHGRKDNTLRVDGVPPKQDTGLDVGSVCTTPLLLQDRRRSGVWPPTLDV